MVQGWIQSDNLMNLDKKQTNIALDVYYSSLLYRTKSLFQTVVKTENFFRWLRLIKLSFALHHLSFCATF